MEHKGRCSLPFEFVTTRSSLLHRPKSTSYAMLYQAFILFYLLFYEKKYMFCRKWPLLLNRDGGRGEKMPLVPGHPGSQVKTHRVGKERRARPPPPVVVRCGAQSPNPRW